MRYNIFNPIHKGLRALLYETALLLQHTNFNNEVEMQKAVARLTLTADLFDDHAHHEDEFVLPAVGKFDPAVVAAFEAEHEKDAVLGEKLRRSIEALHEASAASRPSLADDVVDGYHAFLLFNLEHMAKEEKLLNKILWKHYSDQEIMAIDQQIVQSLTPWSLTNGSRWMMRGLNNEEIVEWLQAAKQTTSREAFRQLYELAGRELPQRRFLAVMNTILDGMMVA